MEQKVNFAESLVGELKARQEENRQLVQKLGDLLEYFSLCTDDEVGNKDGLLDTLGRCRYHLREIVEDIDRGLEQGEI